MPTAAGETRPLADSGALSTEAGSGPWLFLLLQRDRPLAPSARYRLARCTEVTLGRGDSRQCTRTETRLEIAVDDPWMSSTHARIVWEAGRFVLEDAASRNGTTRNGVPEVRATLADNDVIEVGRTFFLFRESLAGEAGDADESVMRPQVPGMLTLSPLVERELSRLAQLAPASIPIVLVGESGTGKEVLARAVHALSGRSGAFVAVNCAELAEGVLQTELFGHKRGAFSGAVEDRAGLVRSAHQGTLLLDELSDLPASGQGALLRVLQEGEVRPVGASAPVHVDARVISATHRDLEALAGTGSFRQDLMARVSGFVFRLLPLRERREDLGVLLRAFFRRYSVSPERVTLSLEATRAILSYDWPLNVRELEQCLAAALAQVSEGPLLATHLHEPLKNFARSGSSSLPPARSEPSALSKEDAARRERLVSLLQETGGNVSAVARSMGHARTQIHRWLRRYQLDVAAFRRS